MVAIATSQNQLNLVYLSSFAVEQYLKICCKEQRAYTKIKNGAAIFNFKTLLGRRKAFPLLAV
jgi:hypothetical protein